MEKSTASYTREDLAAVTRYLVSLVYSDSAEHRAAFLAVTEGNPYSRLVALSHLTAGLMAESSTPPEEVVVAVFELSGRVADSLETGE